MRSVEEWIGRDDDEQVPPRVRLRVFEREGGKCTICTRKVRTGEPWTCEHVIALCNGGKNCESNLAITCCNCLSVKNADDAYEKSAIYKRRAKHLGISLKPKRRFGAWK